MWRKSDIKRNDAFETAYVKTKNKINQTTKSVVECVHFNAGNDVIVRNDELRKMKNHPTEVVNSGVLNTIFINFV